jgi:hypothetical protein
MQSEASYPQSSWTKQKIWVSRMTPGEKLDLKGFLSLDYIRGIGTDGIQSSSMSTLLVISRFKRVSLKGRELTI